MFIHKFISTGFGIGYIGKGAGTAAAVVTAILWYWLQAGGINIELAPLWITLIITMQGIRSSNEVEVLWGKDHNWVVIDEVSGMCISLLFIPVTVYTVVIGLILFRFFDILKPLYIRKLEKWPGGWGVMADDVLAGIYANVILQLIVLSGVLPK